ncbi:hypothetical protein K3152_05955 [Qipengyuania sp. 1NDH17]|uniref:Uncharacterized protein n=1 Tax=Qipengyuania polymorpha TaxID=2867234 RepID=A0ABS7IWR5_9SPHN|nr:hypothetical protein [Qipengyuania polymorpha]MBX7457783.1 hypothetical protein [Qipengyuania polymorpha]
MADSVIRDDLSNKLVHLTKGDDAAFTFEKIVNERRLRGGTGFIKGQHQCVCFSEAPVSKLPFILGHEKKQFKYRPYGFIFSKRFIFKAGGRPVIYQPDPDYEKLPDDKKHLHVRFFIGTNRSIDYTWEREWRVKTDQLKFTPDDVTLLVPQRDVIRAFQDVWYEEHTEPFPWHFLALEDLGVDVDLYLPTIDEE